MSAFTHIHTWTPAQLGTCLTSWHQLWLLWQDSCYFEVPSHKEHTLSGRGHIGAIPKSPSSDLWKKEPREGLLTTGQQASSETPQFWVRRSRKYHSCTWCHTQQKEAIGEGCIKEQNWETEKNKLWVWDHPRLHIKFQDFQGYIYLPVSKKQANNNKSTGKGVCVLVEWGGHYNTAHTK